MKKMVATIVMAFVLFLFIAPSAKAVPTEIWHDGAESGNFSAWTSHSIGWEIINSSANAHSGSRRFQISGPADTNILSLYLPLTGFENITLSLCARVFANLEIGDSAVVKYTANGIDWQNLAVYTNIVAGDWQKADFTLPKIVDNDPLFQLCICADLDNSSDRISFDDFSICGTQIPEPATIFLLCLGGIMLKRR